MPSSPRNGRQSAAQLTTDNLRIINEDPIRHGAAAAGPGPAAVAAANARARRTAGGNAGVNNTNGNPPAGLNARRDRQRNGNYYNGNNLPNAAPAADPGEYYYRRVAPPPQRPARGGRRQAAVYEGLLRNIDHFDPVNDFLDDHENANFNEDGDQYDDLDYDFGALRRLRGAGNRAGGVARGMGAFQNIMEMLGFGGAGDPLANAAFLNAQPANYNHGNPPKRKVKAYSVRHSHPNFNKKKDGKDGFERDIVPPPEVEEETEQVEEDTAAAPLPALSESKERAAIDSITTSVMSMNSASVAEDVEDPNKPYKRNKGKGRALELDPLSVDPASMTAASESNTDIPVLDLAHDSPNGSGSTSSSALFSGKISNSTRATSADQADELDKDRTILDAPGVSQNTVPPPPKPTTRTIRAPVCTSCSTPLFLNQSSTGRPYVLVCGHVICRGCLDIATARFKRWTAEEAEVGKDRNKNGDLESKTAWKGSRLKETFEEVDRSRSSTSTGSVDVKGKKRAGIRIGAPGSSRTATSSSTAVSTRATRAAGRRNIPVPDYANLDDEQEEGEIDGSYLPRTARDESMSLSPQEGDVNSKSGMVEADLASDASDENEPLPELSATTGRSKGKGKGKATNTKDDFGKPDDPVSLGKRKRTKADDDDPANGGKSTSTATKAKAKKQKIEKPSLIDPEWLTCPVRDCKGGTDLGRPIGSREGAWELFV